MREKKMVYCLAIYAAAFIMALAAAVEAQANSRTEMPAFTQGNVSQGHLPSSK